MTAQHYRQNRASDCLKIGRFINWNKVCQCPWTCTHLLCKPLSLCCFLVSIKQYWTSFLTATASEHTKSILLSHLCHCFWHFVPFLHQLPHLHSGLWTTPSCMQQTAVQLPVTHPSSIGGCSSLKKLLHSWKCSRADLPDAMIHHSFIL